LWFSFLVLGVVVIPLYQIGSPLALPILHHYTDFTKTDGQALGRSNTYSTQPLRKKLERYCIENQLDNTLVTGTANVVAELKQLGKEGKYIDGWYAQIIDEKNRPAAMTNKFEHHPTVLRRNMWFVFTCIDISGVKTLIKNSKLDEQEILKTIGQAGNKTYPKCQSFALQIPDDKFIEIVENGKTYWHKFTADTEKVTRAYLLPIEKLWQKESVTYYDVEPEMFPFVPTLQDANTACTRHMVDRNAEVSYVVELLDKYHQEHESSN